MMVRQIIKLIIKTIRYVLGTSIIILGIFAIYRFNTYPKKDLDITNTIIISLLILACFVFGIYFFLPEIKQYIRKKKQKEFESQLVEQLKPYVETIVFKKPLPTITPSIFLKENEEAYIEEFTTFSQPKSHTIRYGGGMRVAKGVYIGGTLPQHVYAIVDIDKGELILTNKRIVFNGNHTTKTIDLEKIISVDVYKNYISIAYEGKEKEAMFSTTKPWVWKVLIYYLKTGSIPPELKIETVQSNTTAQLIR